MRQQTSIARYTLFLKYKKFGELKLLFIAIHNSFEVVYLQQSKSFIYNLI